MSLQPWSWQISVYLIQLVVIFLNVCLWRHSLRSDLEGIDPEKLYLATFICQYALYCYKVWPSFFFVDECFVKIWATCDNFLGKWFTAPSGKKLPVRLCKRRLFLSDFSRALYFFYPRKSRYPFFFLLTSDVDWKFDWWIVFTSKTTLSCGGRASELVSDKFSGTYLGKANHISLK